MASNTIGSKEDGISNPPIVSILIPTYNGQDFLGQAIESALKQSLRELEVVVVDDGSTDNTVSIASSYRDMDPRVRIVADGVRRGLPGNWNWALAHACGRWTKFLFQDDFLAPECLERMISSSQGPFVVSRRAILGHETSEKELDAFRERFTRKYTIENMMGSRPHYPPDAFTRAVVQLISESPRISNFIGEPTSVLAETEALRGLGAFSSDLIQVVDLDMWLRLGSTLGMTYVAEELSTFRVHSGSASSSNLASNALRATLGDQLILFHDLMFSDAYTDLRQHLSKSEQALLRKSLRGAGARARRAVARLAVSDTRECIRWNQVLKEIYERRPKARISVPSWFAFELLRISASALRRLLHR